MNILIENNEKITSVPELTTGAGFRISQVIVYTDIDLIQAAWEALEADIPRLSIFLTWGWMSCWWRHFGRDAELWLLAALDESGRIIAIAPFMLQKHSVGFLQFRRIQFIGSGTAFPAHLDVISHREYQELAPSAFVSYLVSLKDRWDVLDFKGLHSKSRLGAFLQGQPKGWYRQGLKLKAAYNALPPDWESFLRGSISGNLRSVLKRGRRKLEQDYSGQVSIHMVQSQKEFLAAMDSLIVLHQKRWVERGYSTSLANKEFLAFLRSVMSIALTSKRLRFLQLLVGEEVIAVNVCFRNGDVFYQYQKAFDPEWGKYSPGQVIQAETIRMAIQEGAREFNMLHGNDKDKDLWASNVHWDEHILYGHHWRGALWLLATYLLQKARSLARIILSNDMRRKIENVLFRTG